MSISRSAAVLVAAAALACGCEAKVGNDEGNASSAGNATGAKASAEGKAEEGKIAFSAPGFDLKVQLPLDEAAADSESRILYPGSKLTGIYVAAHPDKGSDGSVELRFASPDPPDKVAAWYREPARAGDFALGASAKEGAAWSISGKEKEDGQDFRVRLEPKGTGTDGRLTVRDAR